MYNRNYPFQGNYGYNNYCPPPVKKSFSERVRDTLRDKRGRELMLLSSLAGAGVILYYIIGNCFSFVLTHSKNIITLYSGSYPFRLITDMLYSVICVAFPFFAVYIVLKRLKIYSGGLPFEKPDGGAKLFLLILAGLGLCFAGNIASNIFYSYATSFGVEFYSYRRALTEVIPLPDSPVTAVLMIMQTALVPALMEEFAFRGVVMQPLRKYGDWFAILVSGLIFGLVHGNVMQVPFAVIAGVALGYIAVVSGSLWSSVLLHFLNNFISLVYSAAAQAVNEFSANIMSLLLMYGIISIGLLAVAGYSMENRNFLRLRPGIYGGFRHKTAVYFLAPTMLVGICLMLWLTLNDIVGFADIFIWKA